MLKFGVGIRLFAKLDISEFLEQLNEVRNVRGRVTEIVAEQPYLTKRIRSLVGFALSEEFRALVPERRTHTQILSALPRSFLSTSQVRGVELAEAADNPASSEAPSGPLPITVVDSDEDEKPGAAESDTVREFVLIDQETRESYPLSNDRTRIGRNRDNDIVINSDRASRYHAEIVRAGARTLILDQASRNGVWLNGWRISSAAELKPGDVIKIGKMELTLTKKEHSQ